MVGVQYKSGAILFTPQHLERIWGPPSLLFNWYGALSPWIRRSDVKLLRLVLRYTSTHLYIFMEWYFIAQEQNVCFCTKETIILLADWHTLSSVTGMNIYFHLVVHSYYKQVKSIAPDVSETVSRQPSALSVIKPYPSRPATPLAQYILQVPTLPSIRYPPQKKLSKLDKDNSTELFGSTVSWVEKI
jgi:hypothetical protein